MNKTLTSNQKKPSSKKFGLSNIILIFGLGLLLGGEVYFAYRLHALSIEREQLKQDYSTSNNITFGLFSVDQWREKIVSVVDRQVVDFKMTSVQKKALQGKIEKQLHELIGKTVAEINKPQKTFSGKLKKIAFNSVVNTDAIQAEVPSFAKAIITKVNSPASTKRLKSIASSKIDQLEKETYDSTSFAKEAVTKYLYQKYHVSNSTDFNKQVNLELAKVQAVSYNYTVAMLACVAVALGLWWLIRKKIYLHNSFFIMSLLFAFVLLAVGLTASIIEVDARIGTLDFMLLGQKVTFENQVLFFQSKSILGIVDVLMEQSKPDSILVGILILAFVIVLPVIRLVSRGILVLSGSKLARNRVVKYLALEAGKWDMADVMIVGILMTYIGLNGILKSQLSNLNIHNSLLSTTTVNNTSLQPGYFIFVGYVIFAYVLSVILKRITPHSQKMTEDNL